MKLLIAIVNYHGAALTIDCLQSLKSELAALDGAYVAVCENGSGSAEAMRLREAIDAHRFRDRITLTTLPVNRGFTGGNNAVIVGELASEDAPEAVLLLNNDTIVRPGAIQSLVRFMRERSDVGVCGSRLEYPDGQSQRAARRVLTPASEFESSIRLGVVSRVLSRWTIAPAERDEPHECGWVPGAALMIRRDVFHAIGLLDEDLYTYFDDVDFCLRARRAGWPTWFVPESRIVHLVGKTTGVTSHEGRPRRRAEYWFAARRLYYLKNFGALSAAAADVAAIVGTALWKLRATLQRRTDPDPPGLLVDLIRHSVFVAGFRKRPVPNPAIQTAPVRA
jgi:N-acetylglucosaminyl-diphospho-decaprenol L-rhamnosyltransferase